ncbi:GNAT family N-acetyltransferase [Planctobacterium marinum]|uniref:N-acetyltransferase domain-containing protein n=1 Tax=Planctobacterium marinum TaxID=1631968 RepID=A0AA48KUD2_9ALTE|nr:hypothetical protein MACH26_18560 [Planctobacterium marinum]
MFIKLDNSSVKVAEQIYRVFQNAYKVEAGIIGVSDFPPLKRTIEHITMSDTCFTGFLENDILAAVVETQLANEVLHIHSLTVAAEFFGRGIGKRLMHYVLQQEGYERAHVETALLNVPAINLYKKLGFAEIKRWIPSHGIEKIAFHKTMENCK